MSVEGGQPKKKTTQIPVIKQQNTSNALLQSLTGADDQEHATPILSLCHGILTD